MNRGLLRDRTLGWLHLQMTEHLHVGGLTICDATATSTPFTSSRAIELAHTRT